VLQKAHAETEDPLGYRCTR